MKIKTTFVLFTLICISFATRADLKNWSEYKSENFTLYSDIPEKGAENLLQKLETFRYTVLLLLNIPDQPDNKKLRVMVYDRSEDFNAIRPDSNIAGFFMPTNDGPRMIIGSSRRIQTEVLYHEYVHYLIQEHVKLPVPRWYNEGFAEVLSTMEIKRSRITIGIPDDNRANILAYMGKLQVEKLINSEIDFESENQVARYYATAWLFMHYLQVSPFKNDLNMGAKTTDFVSRVIKGEDTVEAFEASYGMTMNDMDRELLRYQQQKRFTVLYTDNPKLKKQIIRRKLSGNERAYVLSDIAVKLGKDELALEYLQELDPTQKDAAPGLSQLAILENHRDNIDAANQARDTALALGSGDTQVLSNIAHVNWDHYDRTKESGSPDKYYIREVMKLTKSAIDKDPLNLEAYYFQWLAQVEDNMITEALDSMVAAYQIQPGNITINLTLGRFLFDNQRPDLARPFVQRAFHWAHTERLLNEAKKLLEDIDKKE